MGIGTPAVRHLPCCLYGQGRLARASDLPYEWKQISDRWTARGEISERQDAERVSGEVESIKSDEGAILHSPVNCSITNFPSPRFSAPRSES